MNTSLELTELNRKIGQLFMAGIPGTFLDEGTELLIREYNPAGLILFSRNIKDPLQLAGLCRDLQDAAIKYHGSPLFIAVDQEGGMVARLKEPFTVFPGNSVIGMDEDPAARARDFGRITAREMKIVGLNMNLAPVIDVQRGKPEKHLMGRMFSENYETVALLGRTVVRALQENGVMAAAKHFPGLGKAPVDPHFNLPKIDMDIKEIDEINLPPFRAVIEEDVSAIMTSHAIYPALDVKRPATLSRSILTVLLRKQLGFKGLIMTDDLEMGAIVKKYGIAEGALASLRAGADILLICEDQEKVLESIFLIRKMLLEERITLKRLNQSHKRIAETKLKFCKPEEKVSLTDVKKYFRLRS